MTLWQKLSVGLLVLASIAMFTFMASSEAYADTPYFQPEKSSTTTPAPVAARPAPKIRIAELPPNYLVWAATDHVYTVKSGDNLTRIAKRFNVPADELFSYNQDVKNKNLIRVGQKLHIPRFRKELKFLNEVKSYEPVVIVKSELDRLITQRNAYAARIKELEAQNTKDNRLVLFLWVVIFILAMMLVFFGSKPHPTPYLRSLTGQELAKLMDETFVTDEAGNPVKLPNIKDFLANEKRAHLRNIPASQWPEAMQRKDRQAAIDYTAIPPFPFI